MAETDGRDETAETLPEHAAPTVEAHRTSPGRIVLTEEGNSDGWIATDLFVEPRS